MSWAEKMGTVGALCTLWPLCDQYCACWSLHIATFALLAMSAITNYMFPPSAVCYLLDLGVMDPCKCYRTLVACAVLQSMQAERVPHRRRWPKLCWTKPWLLQRNNVSYMPLLMDVHEYNREYFRNFLRMDDNSFQELLHLVKPYIQRQDTRL